MAYALGAVKPWVKDAANRIGPLFGITIIYGWAPGLYDHPRGLALDFMISNLKNGKTTGDQLAAYVVANANAYSVKYVIWYRQEWTPKEGWHKYKGTNPHTDHVHVSFLDAPTGGGPASGGTPGGELIPVGDPLSETKKAYDRLNQVAEWVQNPDNIKRIAVWTLGAWLVLFGVLKLTGITGSDVVTATTNAVKGATTNNGG